MIFSRNKQDPTRLYLLGKLAGDDREEFEQRLFADDKLFEELLAAEDELIDDFLTGDLSKDDSVMFQKHFLVTDERRQRLRLGKAFRKYAAHNASEVRPKPSPLPSWNWQQLFSSSLVRGAAFAAVILIATFGVWRVFFYQSDLDKGLLALNAALRERRPVEVRLTKISYAPFLTTRGPESGNVDEAELRLAELTLLRAKKNKRTPAVQHALGKVYLAQLKFDQAIEELQGVVKDDPNNAQAVADLGAALLEKGKLEKDSGKSDETTPGSGKGLENLSRSLDNLNKALEIDPNLLEALFNRALVYEYLHLSPQALDNWRTYLAKDPNSQWATEAKRHIDELEKREERTSKIGETILKNFLTAYRNRDDDAAWLTISQYRDLTGGPVPNTLIDGYLEMAVQSQQKEALEKLDALSYVSRLEQERAGDQYISDVVRFVRSLSVTRRNSLIEARKLMKQGRESIFNSKPEDAVTYYTSAKDLLEQIGDTTEAVYVQYPLGHAYLLKSKYGLGLSSFNQVVAECKTRQYKWLMAQALNATANAEIGLKNHSEALKASIESLKLSEQIGDTMGVIKTTNQLAQEYFYLGNYPKSLDLHQRSLELSDVYPTEPIQTWRNYFAVPRTLSAMGLHSAAIEYEKEAIRHALKVKMPHIVARSYSILGLMYAEQGNYDEAIRQIEISMELANKLSSEAARKEANAYSSLQLGAIHRRAGEFSKAITASDQAIQLYGELGDQPFSYVAHKGKLLSCINLEGCVSVEEEIKICLELFEEFRQKILEQSNRDSFFDTEQNVYDVVIGYEFSRHNFERAFDYSERGRARSLWDLTNDRAQLLGGALEPDLGFKATHQQKNFEQIKAALPEEAQILQYSVLADRLLIWLISSKDFVHEEKVISIAAVNEKVFDYLKLLASPSGNGEALTRHGIDLYETLIKPVETRLLKDKLLCIVPDKTLAYLPFATLISPHSGNYLVTQYEHIYAPSSTMFIRSTELAARGKGRAGERLLAVGNPRFDREQYSLPDLPSAANEVRTIKPFYEAPSLALIGKGATKSAVKAEMGRFDVMHLAVHSVVDELFPMRSKLLLAGSPGNEEDSAGVLHAYELYGSKFPNTRLVVLSACETGVGRYYRGEGMMGLSRTFLAAGVPLVVSSLWRVDSESTSDLMIAFHKHRKEDRLSSSKSLQRAQLAIINGPDPRYRSPYYWAGFTLAGGYASF